MSKSMEELRLSYLERCVAQIESEVTRIEAERVAKSLLWTQRVEWILKGVLIMEIIVCAFVADRL
jgi:hypothetical protein